MCSWFRHNAAIPFPPRSSDASRVCKLINAYFYISIFIFVAHVYNYFYFIITLFLFTLCQYIFFIYIVYRHFIVILHFKFFLYMFYVYFLFLYFLSFGYFYAALNQEICVEFYSFQGNRKEYFFRKIFILYFYRHRYIYTFLFFHNYMVESSSFYVLRLLL